MQAELQLKRGSNILPWIEKHSTWVALAAFAICLVLFYSHVLVADVPTSKNTEYWWSVDYSNGVNVYPYEPIGFIEGVSCAYMPIYFIITGTMMKIFGTSPIIGKIVSTVAAFGIALLLYHISSKISGRKLVSILPGILFLAYPVTVDYVSTEVKIDILGLFFSTLGLYLVVTKHYFWGAFPAVLAFFTKQFYIAVPLAIGVYLLWTNRKALLIYASTYWVLILVGFVVGQIVSGGTFFEHTILYMFSPGFGEQDFGRTIGSSLVCLGYLMPALILAVYGMHRTKVFGFQGLYLIIALILMVLMLGKEGSGTNYSFESLVAACCLVPLIFGRKEELPNEEEVGMDYLKEENIGGINEKTKRIYPYRITGCYCYPGYTCCHSGTSSCALYRNRNY